MTRIPVTNADAPSGPPGVMLGAAAILDKFRNP